MVRNNRRKAFTIVEIVIVIAVIAILAAVMIPTFSGIIKRANISADVQLSASINTQLSIYKAEGNKIETEADLINALKSDFDFIANLNPKSAKHGYHYWYNAAENKVEVLTYAEVLAKQSQATMSAKPVYLAAGDEADEAAVKPETFAHASPRTVVPGFYLLDQKNGEGENVIAEFFAAIEGMGKSADASGDYTNAINKLTALSQSEKSDNKELAEVILKRINATAIMTDKGTFINTTTEVPTVNYIYIPATPENATDYYLNHTVTHANGASVEELSAAVTGAIEIPAGVKVAEGSFVNFGAITVLVDVEGGVTNLKNVFSAGAVAENATVQVDGKNYTIKGHKVMQGEDHVATLTYRNPVKDFAISASGNVVTTENGGFIALDTIRNNITLTLFAYDFVGNPDINTPVYEDVVWTSNYPEDITIENGVVKFNDKAKFNADSITFTATAVAVNEGTVQKTFTATVVELTGATVKFLSGSNSGSQAIISGSSHTPGSFIVDYESASTTANFTLSDFKYNDLAFDEAEITAMGISTPTAKFTADGTYFTVGSDNKFSFVDDNIKLLVGTIGTQNVSVTLSDKTGEVFSSSFTVTVNDNTNTPFEVAIPSYTNDYTYKVGNIDKLTLEELFREKKGNLNLSEYKVYIYTTEPKLDQDNYYHFGTPAATFDNPAAATQLDFAGITGDCWVVLATVSGEVGEDEIIIEGIEKRETITNLQVEAVAGKNITATSDVFKYDSASKTYPQLNCDYNIVLHDNITLAGQSDKALIVLQSGYALHGNYFQITAEQFKDTDTTTKDAANSLKNSGYSLIMLNGAAQINNLVLNGPVYPETATGSSTNGYFFFGVGVFGSGAVINDSYLFGFLSPIRVEGNDLTVNDSVIEGGTWSNLWVTRAKFITLHNTTTIQNHITGYRATVDDTTKIVLGMGIYIHDDLILRADDSDDTIELTINLTGSTKQYNWIYNTMSGFGGNVDFAKDLVFKDEYAKFQHPKTSKYVNAAIVYQCVVEVKAMGSDLTEKVTGRNTTVLAKNPTIKVNGATYMDEYIDKYAVSGDQLESIKSVAKEMLGNALGSFALRFLNAKVDVWVASTGHYTGEDGNGTCPYCLDEIINLPNKQEYGFEEFYGKINYND